MPVARDDLTGFVPDLLVRRLGEGPQPLPGRPPEATELVVLGLDVSESTSITEDLVRWSPEGPEAVARALDDVFALVSDAVVEHAGSVLTLAGDEVVAVWPAGGPGGPAAAVRAARAAVAVQDRIGGLAPVGGYPIRVRAGVGAGPAWLLDVGTAGGRRVFAPVGPALEGMARAQKSVAAAEIGLSAAAAGLLDGRATTQPADAHPGVRRLVAVDGDAAADPTPRLPPGPAVPELAAPYVPDQVRLGPEIAPVTAVFVSLRARPGDDESLGLLRDATEQALEVLGRYGATVVDAGQDADGLTLVAGYGLPPTVREREAAHAALAGVELGRRLREVVEHGIGIATGHAFCGVCGSPAYRQFMMVGPVVNLAARLMQRAQNEVLCDPVTQHLGRDRLRFSGHGRVDVKGFAGPVEVFRPEWHEADPGPLALRRLAGPAGSVVTRGRDREREELAGRLVALGAGTSSAVVVEGEPGVGKTHLAVDLLQASGAYGSVTVLAGSADEVDRRPFSAWRRVAAKALGLTSVRDPAERGRLVQQRLAHRPDLAPWAPLLDDVLELALDASAVAGMTGPARRENTVRLLTGLLADAARAHPLLVLLDDCQWLDSASWELLRAVRREVSPAMLVLFTRPLPDDGGGAADAAAGALADLREHGALTLRLHPLPADATEEIAQDYLGVAVLDDALRELFRGRVDGSPLFAVELAFQLRTDEVVSVTGGPGREHARLAVPPEELARLRLPVRVEEVFRARLGVLSEHQRAVVRAASVVGTTFDERRLRGADPALDPGTLTDDLRELERRKVVTAAPDGWQFVHALLRDVARQSFLPSELRQRHRALAEWYEAHDPGPADYALLARHWAEAGDPAREVEYLEAAGTHALAKGADEEAAALLRTALARAAEPAPLPGVPDGRRAFWHDELAEALTNQNRLDDAVAHFATALALVGRPLPRSRPGMLLRLLREAIVQLGHLARAPRLRRGDAAALGQAAWILAKLAEAYYFKAAALPWAVAALASVNRAERAGEQGVAAPAYSGLAALVGTLRLHRLAARYLRRSRAPMRSQPTGSASTLTLGVLPDRAWQYGLTATVAEAVYLRTMDRRVDVVPMLDRVVGQARTLGQAQDLEICLAVRGVFAEVAGRLRAARADFEELLRSARRRGNTEHEVWGTALLVPLLVDLGRRAEALGVDEDAAEVFREEHALAAPIFAGSHVEALVLRGRTGEALAAARSALRRLGVPSFFHLPGLTALARGCLELVGEDRATARRAVRALRRYARLYPFARARHLLHAGRYRAAVGRPRAARRSWTRGVRAADQAGLLLDGARMRFLLAAQLPEGSPDRAAHLARARRDVDELGLRRLAEFRQPAA
ncbi:AAA family ATPase [Geodermatophilus sp. SYSU D00815]